MYAMYIVMGIAAAFNVLVIWWKATNARVLDSLLDGGILIVLSWVFGGTLGGMLVATVSSAIVSLYFLAVPPKFSWS